MMRAFNEDMVDCRMAPKGGMATDNGILTDVDRVRRQLTRAVSRARRSQVGQFLTPAPIALFMASLFEQSCRTVRVLDAGAGAGALSAALVTQLCQRREKPSSIEVVCYENDPTLTRHLKETLDLCRAACADAGIHFAQIVHCEDFVQSALSELDDGLFAPSARRFTHAILNPPYKKIGGGTVTRRLLDAAGFETTNLYAAFVWLAARLLLPCGEIVAITPRSFCNGPYFRRFRKSLLALMNVRRLHLFESRKAAFAEDSVLQENVIFFGVRAQPQSPHVTISVSDDADFAKAQNRTVAFREVVRLGDDDAFIHLVDRDEGAHALRRISRFHSTLSDLGLDVSTGRVVDFRAKKFLRRASGEGLAPLIYPCHFENGYVRWPRNDTRKPNAIVETDETRRLLVKAGHYVLVKRFSAKEERKRVVSAIFDPARIASPHVGFENHINYFHAHGGGMPASLARGLSLFLNSTLFDRVFRLFSGHTQVNATDLRSMRYPSREELIALGKRIENAAVDQDTTDSIMEEEFGENN